MTGESKALAEPRGPPDDLLLSDAPPHRVSCAEDAGSFEGKVRYGIAATLEIAENVNLPIFNEMKARIRLKAKVATKTS